MVELIASSRAPFSERESIASRYSRRLEKLRAIIDFLSVSNHQVLKGLIRTQTPPITNELRNLYSSEIDTINGLFGSPEAPNDKVLFHGTGAYRYSGDKYTGSVSQEVVPVFNSILESGIVPSEDPWLPVGNMLSTSLTANYFYANWYADKYEPADQPVLWQFGSPHSWFKFFASNTAIDELQVYLKKTSKRVALRELTRQLSVEKRAELEAETTSDSNALPKLISFIREDITKQMSYEPGAADAKTNSRLNKSQRWISHLVGNVTPDMSIQGVLRAKTDISTNWGIVISTLADNIEVLPIIIGSAHELRTAKMIAPELITSYIVPLAQKSTISETVQELGLKTPVLSREAVALHFSRFPFSGLVGKMNVRTLPN